MKMLLCKQIFGFVFLCTALALSGEVFAFDCSKATTKVEKLICSDKKLFELDKEMNAYYKEAVKREPQEIRDEQRKWLKIRNACIEVGCISAAYEEKIDELKSFIRAWDKDMAYLKRAEEEAKNKPSASENKQQRSSSAEPKPADVDMFCSGLLFRASGLINDRLSIFGGDALKQMIQLSTHLENSANRLMQRAIVLKGSAESANTGVSVANDVIGRNINGLLQRGSEQHKAVMGCLQRLQ